ncbi:MAG: hypothetical protein M0017_11260 [Desulfobacteraceae bacterium]|nr:hypothetical protein [Desulfobacteraceae bacterium]
MLYPECGEIRIFDGESFVVSGRDGEMSGQSGATEGFFYRDTRFLSRFALRVNGERLSLLNSGEIEHYCAIIYATLPYSSIFDSHPITVIRHRAVGNGMGEILSVHNYMMKPAEIRLELSFEADFGDIMEVRQGKRPEGEVTVEADRGRNRLVFVYQVGPIHKRTIVALECPAQVHGCRLACRLTLPPKGKWSTRLTVIPVWEDRELKPRFRFRGMSLGSRAHPELGKWLGSAPRLVCSFDLLSKLYRKSLVDLQALNIHLGFGKDPVIGAGMPWYMALEGRDALIAGLQCAHISPKIGMQALEALSALQGRTMDTFTEEEPGKMPHELRFGEKTQLGELPYRPYYGTADATPLFLILLHELYRWTGDAELVRRLRRTAIEGLTWIDRYGDRDGDGYVEYQKASPKGIRNQCWKDSDDSIVFSNGELAEGPIAAAEIQGYVYDAWLRTAELAEEVWEDGGLAQRLREAAAGLKRRFNEDFWIPERGGYFALALDGRKRRVDSITSNMGQLLWSGIVEEEKAEKVAAQLMHQRLFNGWGVRTMSDEDMAFNPIEYHNGTVWPHDNSLIAAGLARYGFPKEAGRIILGMIEASAYYGNRFPEVFAGYRREEAAFPVLFPRSAFPQAWAAGACMLMIRTLLGIEPDRENRRLRVDPHLPPAIARLALENIPFLGGRYKAGQP